ncbi:hypothetical protein HPT27_00380 [Permianibacter sp. IMCC34836]|uniref:alpha/beta fold hydrolase n=1 Tax=Permianibacter fluminis TaxID=2738515 RepID=UPI0015520B94|nr:alpha/beta fold hydrolase [Permianibacter fluminis]NQD35457.1 hypothetical protein [Permianibacter fluminis]
MKPILVLLPGLDGSGQLFTPLLTALGDDFDCRVLALPTDGEQTPITLAQRLLQQLPTQRFVLLAESFSGAIAAEIATMQPANLAGLILVATFLQTPRPWLLQMPKPVVWLGWRLHRPLVALWWPFCGYRSDVSTRDRVLASLRILPWSTLWQRLQAIRTLPARPFNILCPAISIHAQADRLIPASARAQLDCVASSRSMRGPHFLLQSEPVAAATLIRDWFDITFPETG